MALAMRSALVAPARAVAPAFRAFAPVRVSPVQRGALQVVAAEPGAKKVVKKKTPSPVKRASLSEDRRMYNRQHKSACATRVKKVIKMAESMMSAPPKSEEEVKSLEQLISEAYSEIDKAVVKGIMHQNTAARKKARCTRYKKAVLMVAGLYTPAADSADYARYQRITAKKH